MRKADRTPLASSGLFLSSFAHFTMFGTARAISSTTATSAARVVRDNGFRSMEMTFFPALAMASARSPSSSGIRTTSAASNPWLVQRARSDAIPSRTASCSLPSTFIPVSLSTRSHTF
ncbi:MAG TPA: hypothetical protein HA343_07965, partial [Methanomassiliicoccales archaeon]|nr:hypothetical protein [Methanomassiliicoccales archaeon]